MAENGKLSMISSVIPFAAATLSFLIACAALLKRRSLPTGCFFVGMTLLASDSVVNGVCLGATDAVDALRWLTLGLILKSFMPAAWLSFSVMYSRGDFRKSLKSWSIPLGIMAFLPIVASLVYQQDFFKGWPADTGEGFEIRFTLIGKAVTAIILLGFVWILTNFEHTFRAAVGAMRWRIKFVMLGLGLVVAAQVYVRSQAVVFSTYDLHWLGVESSALLIGCVFLVVGYIRTGLPEINVYPSRAIVGTSLTGLIISGYLFTIGILANITRHFGGAEYFQLAALIVLLGVAGAVLLAFSDRLRQRLRRFVSRHFVRAQHDSVQIWTAFSQRLAKVDDPKALCVASAKLISESFETLSVTIWLVDEQNGQLAMAGSTATHVESAANASYAIAVGLRAKSSPFDLDRVREPWADELCLLNPAKFPKGGSRWCVPLRAAEESVGAVVLADRVNGAAYTGEELHLLQCIADQVSSVLLNLRLAGEVARAREMDAFRTMSAFFVHDLKNTAASLNLMLQNARAHFDDPAFREDAFRAIGNAARRIDEIIGRLTTLRQRPEFKPVETDLNELVSEVLQSVDGMPRVELAKELQPLPRMLADREQIRSVVSNLVLNARDAIGPDGWISVRTEHVGESVVLTVADNGCGMSPQFIKDSLFRPFQSTKKTGLGIGLFQSRMVVEAHGGKIRVESERGKGSTLRVSLPTTKFK